ncbi:histidine kinase [Nonomuraea sp. NBC_01738]|uniref:sensor histidine kinase n=1 Tax=Nonomuraea sp. NBC_01738 TaxID=2976003 RepID=UPI002E1321E9|nr:histidine kinase [Nonomuraea sp. NBC_01738]
MNRADIALASVVAVVMVANSALTGQSGVLDYALLLVSAAMLALHRKAPRAVLALTTLCALLYILRVEPELSAGIPALITVTSTIRHGHRLVPLLAELALIFGMVGAYLLAGQDTIAAIKGGFLVAGWFVAAVAMGAALREVDERAVEVERSREETAHRRAGEERLRIARELHDSLTHTISIIKVQAGVAVHLARKRGEEPLGALQAIQEASGEAMRELRATLEVLRDDTVALTRLPQLVERARAAGQPVELTVTGRSRTLPGEVEQAAYRIVQEALTNVSRHAGGAGASVHVDYGSDGLVLRIDDDGAIEADETHEAGVGLIGMRERVTALGGSLSAGPRSDGGFSVLAELPVNGVTS